MAKAARPLFIGLCAVLLASCASFSTPPETFDLAPPRTASIQGASRAQLLIPEPTAIRTLDSQQIAIMPTSLTVEYLPRAQWTDRLPRLVQLRLLEAFQNTGRAGAAGVPGQGLAIDYQIVTELRRFEISLESGSAVVEISVKALNDQTGQVRAAQIFQSSVPLTGSGNAASVLALNAAFANVTDQIVGWTLRLV
ncbi:ABC-type transport auxiliary lipoprotein family protein [Aureimonas populi]|uniref:ABC-type transport auxiliary lipoprotein family protein n=1 Tax=Aureimonas populi TaxID=1701758 RepID=A0ABW5CMU9_9HYPH|nr:ABC-type transport auxiliary lipoprotein family protein [Aureimonas populi]